MAKMNPQKEFKTLLQAIYHKGYKENLTAAQIIEQIKPRLQQLLMKSKSSDQS
jgi:hypothetical protein